MKILDLSQTPLKSFTKANVEERKKIDIKSGDTIRVHIKITEKNKTRIQIFEGVVLSRKHGNEPGATITVRKVSNGYGIEKIFPLFSPNIDKIEIVKKGRVRKSKLYYLRDKVSREIRRQMRRAKIVNISTTSDIEENEKKIKEAEATKQKVEAAEKELAAKEAAKTSEENNSKEENTEVKNEITPSEEKKR